jgi:eukaryotic-like serine/threonine-protein kinase
MSQLDDSTPDAEQLAARALQMGPRERKSYVEYHCHGDAALLAQVQALLKQADVDAHYWQHVPDEDEWQPRSLKGARIGVFQLETLLGAGGMSEVYLASRRDGEFEQQVAIKLVRNQLLNDDIRQRLRTERQILANLRHPNVASLFDGGTAPDGSPYLVMEYIKGVPIDLYCDREKLTIEQRVALFCKVCAAVQCAHQNLIVHRDLKPTNILVTDDGEPKLLDFGIAKLLEREVAPEDVAVTQYGFRLLTPAHAAPEQVRGEPITTACDVYVLGVVLYELLCGRRPFTLPVNCRLSDIEKLVCRTTPPLMSDMVARTAEVFPVMSRDICQSRHTTTHKLIRTLRGDLDNIVRMTMRKNPVRRYASATQLADELQNWLHGRPVQAVSDRWLYRGRKFVRRHAVASSAVAGMAVVAGAIALLSWWYVYRTEQQRQMLANERQRAEQASGFMLNLFEVADPTHRHGNELSARLLLDIGTRRLDDNLQLSSTARATLLAELGKAYGQLGLYAESADAIDKAMQTRIAAFGVNDAGISQQLPVLAQTQIAQGRLDEAERTLNRTQALIGSDASPVERATLAQLQGELALARAQPARAETYWQSALTLLAGRRLWLVAAINSDLAQLHVNEHRYDQAATNYRDALNIGVEVLGETHPQVALLQWRLGELLGLRGSFSEASALMNTALTTQRRVLGRTHPTTLESLEELGDFLRLHGQLGQARAMITEALLTHRHEQGEQSLSVAHDRVRLGNVDYDAGQYEEAALQYRGALALYEPDGRLKAEVMPPQLVSALTGLGRSEWRLGHLAEARTLAQRAMRMAEQKIHPQDSTSHYAAAVLGLVLLEQGERQSALKLLSQAAPYIVTSDGEQGVLTQEVSHALAHTPPRTPNLTAPAVASS